MSISTFRPATSKTVLSSHSREGGNPLPPKWSTAFAGATAIGGPRHWLAAVFLALTMVRAVWAQTVGVSIPAWIEGSPCEMVPQFEASLNGKRVPVLAQLGPASDQIILVVFDLTGDLALIDAAKQAVSDQISKLPANVWVGLLRDEEGLRVLVDPGPERAPLIKMIQSLPNSGAPGLLGSVQTALALADALIRKAPVRVAVLYLTDSSIYNYREDYTNPVINESDPHDLSRRFPGALIQEKISRLVDAASSLEPPLFVVHLNYRRDKLNLVYQNGLETLAEATGGRTSLCRSVAEIPEAISGAFARMLNGWRVTLAFPAKLRYNTQIHLSAPCRDEALRLSWRTHFHPKGG